MKTLFIGNLTIDLIENENTYRIGGPGFYGGRALSEGFKIETYVLTNIVKNYRDYVINVMNNYSIKVLEIESEVMPIFVILKGKAKEFRGASPKIPSTVIKNYVKLLNPNIVILAPVMRELDLNSIDIIKQNTSKVLSIDIQGFVRTISSSRIACTWSKDLEEKLVLTDVVHGNIMEFCFATSENDIVKQVTTLSTTSRTLYLVSLDQRGTYAIHEGEIFYIPSLPITAVDDVGAGDVLLAVTTYYKAKGEQIIHAVVKGVIAASLKVKNAYTTWFNKEVVESIYKEHLEKVRVINI